MFIFASSFFQLASMQARWLELEQPLLDYEVEALCQGCGAPGYEKLRSLAKWGWLEAPT